MNRERPFLALWTLAIAASVAAFILQLALRGRTVELGYQLGRARSEQARLREVKRVLELEAASYETPQRVEIVAKTLLGMQSPSADHIYALGGPPVQTITVLQPARQNGPLASTVSNPAPPAQDPASESR